MKLIITEEEKSRIIGMHQNATSRQYLIEQEGVGDNRNELIKLWSGKKVLGNSYLRTYDATNTFKISGPGSNIIQFELYGDPMAANKAQNYNYLRALYKYNPTTGTWYDQNGVERQGDLEPYNTFIHFPGDQKGEWNPDIFRSSYGIKDIMNNMVLKKNNPFMRDLKIYLGEKKPTQPQKP
jgi:hypothetical protein